jgi:ubiquinone/menaquinone biosynthesis C-methylase UbiE
VAEYDAVADAYSRVIDPEGAGLEDARFQELLGDVAGQSVFSLACGQGQDARLLARLGATVVGVDVSERMLEQERESRSP